MRPGGIALLLAGVLAFSTLGCVAKDAPTPLERAGEDPKPSPASHHASPPTPTASPPSPSPSPPGAHPPPNASKERPPSLPVVPSVRFIAWGDAGTGGEDQYAVSKAAEEVCARLGCDFVLQAGDNIYEAGVSSPYDPQFETKFEKPYANLQLPFYLVLGNHDSSLGPGEAQGTEIPEGLGDGLSPDRGDHQVQYTYRLDRLSDKWNMPARYYSFERQHVHFFGLDTNHVNAGRDTAEGQAKWLRSGLEKSASPWKIVFAHHPYVSNGKHGNAGSGDPTSNAFVKSFVEGSVCGLADVYITGHDHDLQWLKPVAGCGRTEFIISGAASGSRELGPYSPVSAKNEAFFEQGHTLGFFWIRIEGGTFTGQVYDGSGKLLFERSFTKEIPAAPRAP